MDQEIPIADDQLTPRRIIQMHLDEALRIDAATAEVETFTVDVTDPYGVSGAEYCMGRLPFVRNPEGRLWVEAGDLPAGVWEKIQARLDADRRDRGGSIDDDLPW